MTATAHVEHHEVIPPGAIPKQIVLRDEIDLVTNIEAIAWLDQFYLDRDRIKRDLQTLRFIKERELQAEQIAKDKAELDKKVEVEMKLVIEGEKKKIVEAKKKEEAEALVAAKKHEAEAKKQEAEDKKEEAEAKKLEAKGSH